MASMGEMRMARRAGICAERKTVASAIRAAASRDSGEAANRIATSRAPIIPEMRGLSRRIVTHIPPQPASRPSGMPMSATVPASA